ncbi:MAG: hypothetical protein HKO95_13840 [Rhodobacteraceae bacterium]|nr:hypothetical protein [Alphaproteobacteria bacterium]NNK67804.1 hypothetical protein [Paracoccaceae bacterium]
MRNVLLALCAIGIWTGVHSVSPAMASGVTAKPTRCALDQIATLPARSSKSRPGSGFVQDVRNLSGAARDAAVTEQVLSGNVPEFLRKLVPVTLSGTRPEGQRIDVEICVTPDYLAVGDNSDFVRVPVGLPAAAGIAADLGFMLPTTKMVDAIYAQADLRLPPAPMPPTAQMASTDYFWRHHATVEEQRGRAGQVATALTAGQKKDIVLSNRLRTKVGRVAIYGWHRPNGKPIQPLSTVHGAYYADYSHGVRLVSGTAFVNGTPYPLAEILEDPQLSQILSNEGPIPNSTGLLVSFR